MADLILQMTDIGNTKIGLGARENKIAQSKLMLLMVKLGPENY